MKRYLIIVVCLVLNSLMVNAQVYPFTEGTKFNCRSQEGETNKFYVVINSTKTAKNCYSFVMEERGAMMSNDKPSLDGYVKGTWDNGKVILKKVNKSNEETDAECFEWNGSFFKSFYGYYAEADGAPQQSIQIKNLPGDYKLNIDGCQVRGGGSTKNVSLVKGIHRIEIYAQGYKNFKTTVDTRNGQSSNNFVVNYPAEKGVMAVRISFENVPQQSILYIDGKKDKDAVVTSSPNISMQMIYTLSSECTPGNHSYKIVSPGFKESSGTIEVGNAYWVCSFIAEFIPDTVEKIQLFINGNNLPSDKFSLGINGVILDNFADAFLNANQDNMVAVYDKEGTMIWVQNIYADKYNYELSEYARYPHWLHRVRGVPENTDILMTDIWNNVYKFAKIGECYYYPQFIPSETAKWNIKAVNNQDSDVIFDADFIVEPDSIGALADIVIDKSLVKDKWTVGDLFPGDDGKPIGIVIATTDGGEHGTILSLEEFNYRYVISDGKRQYGSYYAALWALKSDEINYPKTASFTEFVNHLRRTYFSSSNPTDEEISSALKKYFPAFYYADKYKVGSYTEWYLPDKNEMKKVFFMSDFLNKKIGAANLTPVLDFENNGYMTTRLEDVIGNTDNGAYAEHSTRFMLEF